MKTFHCDHCGHLAFFENTRCLGCGRRLAFAPDLGVVASFDERPDGTLTTPLGRARGGTYKRCANDTGHDVCNVVLPAADPNAICASCRLTTTIPDLTVPAHKPLWYKLEAAKRRLLYTLIDLKLTPRPKADDPAGLAFEFLADAPDGTKVLTGHADGLITLNIAEADDAEREKRRVSLNEPYRTLLGHFRHEVGHYYWDRLVRDGGRTPGFRNLFGDESADYGQALKRHYAAGPPAGWEANYISAYAAAHPWEDWAETFAHYLHIVDAVETAADCGLSLAPPRSDEPAVTKADFAAGDRGGFDRLVAAWHPLSFALNNFNRGLGLGDAYPFVLSPAVVGKLRFVHETIASAA